MRQLNPPLLVCMDFQREFQASGRPLHIDHPQELWRRALDMLAFARSEHWLVAHAFIDGDATLFGRGSEFARPIHGFEPHADEMVFSRGGLSAYGNIDFRSLVERNARSATLLMGPGGPLSVLATAFNAYDVGHRLVLLEDLIGALSVGGAPHDRISEATVAICRAFHRVVPSDLVMSSDFDRSSSRADERECVGRETHVHGIGYFAGGGGES